VLQLLEHLTGALGPWTYAIVGALVFMETVAFVGLLAPGEVTLVVGGAAAANGDVALLPMLALVWACGVLGDLAGFTLGRRYGNALVRMASRRLGEARMHRIDSGLARFVGPVRVFAAFIAGTSGMSRRRLVALSIVGVGLWAPTLVLATYLFADAVGSCVQIAGYVVIALVAAWAGVRALRRRRTPAMAR
jgi:membrane-associated protein